MAATEDKELAYGYFSQVLLPNYIEEHGADWNVVYDARGHFIEPHTNRRAGCGTIASHSPFDTRQDDVRNAFSIC